MRPGTNVPLLISMDLLGTTDLQWAEQKNHASKIAGVHKQTVQSVDLINDIRLCTTTDSTGEENGQRIV